MTVWAKVVNTIVVAHSRAVILSHHSSTMMNYVHIYCVFYDEFNTKIWIMKSSNTNQPITYVLYISSDMASCQKTFIGRSNSF